MKYVVVERSQDGVTTYFGPFYLERQAQSFVAASVKGDYVTYEICVIYQSRELTQRINDAILNTQEGTS